MIKSVGVAIRLVSVENWAPEAIMATEMTDADRPRKRRRWLPRIALRTVLALVTILAVSLAWIGNAWHRVERQRQVVKQIEATGGRAHLDYRFITEASLNLEFDADPATEDWVDEVSLDPKVPSSRYRTNDRGRVIERQVETPPGPSLIRRMMGDDLFSFVEIVDFFNWENEPRRIDPRVLLELPRLKVVVLSGSQVNDEWLAVVAQLPELRSVALYGGESSTATEHGLASLRHAKHLKSLALHGAWVNDNLLRGVSELTQLQSLSIAQTPNVTSAVFLHIHALKDLQHLIIVKCSNINDQQAVQLKSLHQLRTLWLIGASIGDDGLEHIAELKSVDYLLLDENNNITDRGGERLASMTKLKIVSLANTNVGDRTVRALARSPLIWNLDLGGTQVTNNCVRELGSMSGLLQLELSPTDVSDDGLASLASLQKLERLHIGPNVSLAATNELRQRLPNCDVWRFNSLGQGSLADSNPTNAAADTTAESP